MKDIPESSPSPWPITRVSIKAGFPFGFAYAMALYFPGLWGQEAPAAWWILLVLAVVLFLGASGIYYWCRWLAALDELQRLIQLKAFALAIPVFLGLAVTGELLLQAGLPGFKMGALLAVPVFGALQFASFLWFSWRSR